MYTLKPWGNGAWVFFHFPLIFLCTCIVLGVLLLSASFMVSFSSIMHLIFKQLYNVCMKLINLCLVDFIYFFKCFLGIIWQMSSHFRIDTGITTDSCWSGYLCKHKITADLALEKFDMRMVAVGCFVSYSNIVLICNVLLEIDIFYSSVNLLCCVL